MLCALILIILVVYISTQKKYEKYAREHSKAILSLLSINNKYTFNVIPPCTLSYHYDNEVYYQMISTWDYLVYQLVYIKKNVLDGIKKAAENATRYNSYQKEIASIYMFGAYNDERKFLFPKWLLKIEKKIFNKLVYYPVTSFNIWVTLYLTNLKGVPRDKKHDCFYSDHITDIIQKLDQKHGDFYLNNDIWKAICRVERGKVSNKIRFAIYERDGYRCRKCGRSTDDLEIDHIFPISKGGKTTFDNLQTLCHRCNTIKSNNIEPGSIDPKTGFSTTHRRCPTCGAPLIYKRGKNGYFYGCSNYPRCRHTENA